MYLKIIWYRVGTCKLIFLFFVVSDADSQQLDNDKSVVIHVCKWHGFCLSISDAY